ncbi:MAG TPA: hypothetical protein VLU91_06570 [Nitrososphaerales archaeon]|nr:hypothetical protein [Nitrososphaerales archaeon]
MFLTFSNDACGKSVPILNVSMAIACMVVVVILALAGKNYVFRKQPQA